MGHARSVLDLPAGRDIEHPGESTWDVIFKDDRVLLQQVRPVVSGDACRGQGRTLSIEWHGVSVNIGGAGAMRKAAGSLAVDLVLPAPPQISTREMR